MSRYKNYDTYIHLIVPRLSVEALKAGVLNVAGLTDRDLAILVDEYNRFTEFLENELQSECDRRDKIRRERRHKVVPFPGCGQPEDYYD